MPVEAGAIFKEIDRGHTHFGNKTLCFDGNCEHVLTNTLKVDDQDHVVHLWEAWDEFDLYFCLLVFLKLAALILYDELGLRAAAVARDPDNIVDVYLRGVCEEHGLPLGKFVGNFAEIDGILRESECRGYDVALECESQHLGATFEGKSEGFREFSEDVGLEGDLEQVSDMVLDSKSALGLAEVELRSKWCLIRDQLPMAVDFAGILNAQFKGFLVSDKNVANVHLRDRQLGLRALALPCEVEGESLLVAGHVCKGRARVMVGTLRAEGYATGHLSVGPNFSFQWLNLEDLVLEEHFIFLYSLSDRGIFPGQSRDCSLFFALLLGVELALVVRVVGIEALVLALVFALLYSLLNFFFFLLLLLAELQIEPGFLGLFLDLSGEGPPRKLDWDRTFVDNLVVLMRIEGDGRRIGVYVALGKVYVVVVGFTDDWDLGGEVVID